jgi:hypothetical protein
MLMQIGVYFFVSKKDGSLINVLSLYYLTGIPTIYILPLFHDYYYGIIGSFYANAYVYLCYFIPAVVFAITYVYGSKRRIYLPWCKAVSNVGLISILFILFACMLNEEIFVMLVKNPFDPRLIYTTTRTGFGIYTYLSALAAYVAMMLVLFVKQKRLFKVAIYFLGFLVLYSHGSKGQIIGAVFIPLLYLVYVRGYKLSKTQGIFHGILLLSVIVLSFFLTMKINFSIFSFFNNLSGYANYISDAVKLVDSNVPIQWGKLTFENNFYSIIPRSIDPGVCQGRYRLDDAYARAFSGSNG